MGRCFLVSIGEVWFYKEVTHLGHYSNRYCVAELELKVYL